MLDLQHIEAALRGHSLIHEVGRVPRGHIRLETAFLYPDGTSVEVYLVQNSAAGPLRLSDLGQTTAWLLDLQIKPWLSKRRQALAEDVIQTLGVQQSGGALELPLESLDTLMSGVVRLAQACIRIADLIYTRRAALQSSYSEELEELFVDSELSYETDVELPGRFHSPVRVDYLVSGTNTRSLVLGWSSGNSSQAHVIANELFRKWFDLDTPERAEQRVTIFDDRYDIYRQDDLNRIRNYSSLLALSDRQALRDVLAA